MPWGGFLGLLGCEESMANFRSGGTHHTVDETAESLLCTPYNRWHIVAD